VISPNDEPRTREIADVTETTVCLELQKTQKIRPANKHA